jgi:hypothetical protein
MNFAAIGLSCEDNGQLTVLSTPKVVILLTVEHMFVTVPKALPHNRVREVVTQDILEQAMRGELTVPALNAIFGKLIELRIDTVIPMQGDEGKQQHPVGAFAAAKSTSFAPSGSAGKPGHGQGSSQFAQERGRHQERRGGGSGRQRSRSQDTTTVEVYKKSIDFILKNGPIKFLQNLHNTCKSSLGATLFEGDQKGTITMPLTLCKGHSWSQYGDSLSYSARDARMGNDLFAALMLARDIFSDSDLLTKTGIQHRSDNDSSWSKPKANKLRGDIAIAGTRRAEALKSRLGNKGKGDGKGKKYSMVGAAATASTSFSTLLDDELGAGDKE